MKGDYLRLSPAEIEALSDDQQTELFVALVEQDAARLEAVVRVFRWKAPRVAVVLAYLLSLILDIDGDSLTPDERARVWEHVNVFLQAAQEKAAALGVDSRVPERGKT